MKEPAAPAISRKALARRGAQQRQASPHDPLQQAAGGTPHLDDGGDPRPPDASPVPAGSPGSPAPGRGIADRPPSLSARRSPDL